MPPCLADISPLIYRCALTGISPPASQWEEEATNYFREFIEVPESAERAGCLLSVCALKCATIGGGGGVDYQVRIDSPDTKSKVAKKLIEKGLAKEPTS